MEVWGSFSVVAILALVHLTVADWSVLRGRHAQVWFSVSAGTALAYVFAYLLPKMAAIQTELSGSSGPTQSFLRNHVYLFALCGLLTYFALLSTLEERGSPGTGGRRIAYAIALQTIGYSFYSLQLGYLATDFAQPGMASYVLTALVLGLHLMGIDSHLHRMHPVAYRRIMRYAYTAALFAGWGGGMLTDAIEPTVMYSSTFVAGGIIITAIREELPGRGHPRPVMFFAAVFVACAIILTLQYWDAG